MSTKLSEKLKKDQGPRENASVYDFLYYDAQRVGVFLSQFSNYGHLTQLTKGREANERSKTVDATDGSVSVPGFAKARGSVGSENESLDKLSKQETYDPTWLNLLAFLDILAEQEMLKRDINAAGIGQFVLASGTLEISDLQLVEKTWKLRSVEKAVRSGNKNKMGSDEIALLFDILSILPHTIQVKLVGSHSIWSTISHRWLTVSTSDILLSHGRTVPGEWNVVGILDARPNPLGASYDVTPNFGDPTEIGTKFLDIISPICRQLLGRPQLSFGVTPLAIFREVVA